MRCLAEWGSLLLSTGIEMYHRFELKQPEEKGEVDANVNAAVPILENDYLKYVIFARRANHSNVAQSVHPINMRNIPRYWMRKVYGLLMEE